MSVVETERNGLLTEFYDEDTGLIREDGTGQNFEFAKPGAQRDFIVGEGVIFITITTPKGKIITKDVVKRNN